MYDGHSALNALSEKIHRSFFYADLLSEILTQLCGMLGLFHAKIFIADVRTERFGEFHSVGLTKDVEADYRNALPLMKEVFPTISERNIRRIFRWAELFDLETFGRSRFHRDVFSRIGAGPSAGGFIARVNTTIAAISLHRRPGAPEFTDDEIALLQSLMPHFETALRARHSVEFGCHPHGPFTALAERLTTGVMLVSESAQCAWANSSASRVLRLGEGLSRTWQGYLVAAQADDTQQLHGLIGEMAALDSDRSPMRAVGMRLSRSAAAHPLSAIVLPLGRGLVPALVEVPARAIVFVGDPGEQLDASIEALSLAFGLTRTEARIAAAVARGTTPTEFAAQNGIGVGTVRWHIKNILGKTSLRRQSDLVRMVVKSPATWLTGIYADRDR